MDIVIKVLRMVIKQVSPDLRVWVKESVADWKVKAAATSNPWDDLACELLEAILSDDA